MGIRGDVEALASLPEFLGQLESLALTGCCDPLGGMPVCEPIVQVIDAVGFSPVFHEVCSRWPCLKIVACLHRHDNWLI